MKVQSLLMASCLIGAAPMSAVMAQEWEVFFDSGFESLPLGPLTEERSLLPHLLVGLGSGSPPQRPWVVSSPDPVIDTRAIRLEALYRAAWDADSLVTYGHVTEKFGKPTFDFPGGAGRGGYRAMRVSFAMYHASDSAPGRVWWPGGGVTPYTEPPTAQIVADVTAPVEAVFDEWIGVSLTFDFENGLMSGSYADHMSPPVALPADLRELTIWRFRVTAAIADPPAPDIETVWVDNLIVEVIPPCPADFDVDYAHTFFDFLAFQNSFAAGSLRADCDLDGELTFLDFLCFQNYFAQGCN